MKSNKIILATNDDGKEIELLEVKKWINNVATYKKELSDFIYYRLFGRYIKPFKFNCKEYISNYKNGFSIMANCCLLIESFGAFREPIFIQDGNSERCFGWFFQSETIFNCFSKGGLPNYLTEPKVGRKNNIGIPRDFYSNVRCGILHSGETRNGWKIRRSGPLFNESEKSINANSFMNNLNKSLQLYRNNLRSSDHQLPIWTNCLDKIKNIIDNI